MCKHETKQKEMSHKLKRKENKYAKGSKCSNMKEYNKKRCIMQKEKRQKGRIIVHTRENVGRKEAQ